jgi:uncharacterized membrane protein YvlD (DUF360 family)
MRQWYSSGAGEDPACMADSLPVDNFLWAILGALVLSIFSFILNWFTGRAATRSKSH